MTQSYNLSQLANNLNSSGQLDATDGLVGAVPVANGGTSFAAYTVGDILYASGSTAFAKLADVATGNALISGGVGAAPAYGKIGLTTHISGTLAVSNGGTGAATLAANNVLLGNGTSALQTVAPGTAGNVLTSNGTTWSSSAATGTTGPRAQYFTTVATGQTFTIPTGVTSIKVTVVGGGGGGGGTLICGTTPQPGGTGASAVQYFTGLTPGNTLTIAVGGGGAGGAAGGGNGSSGGTSNVASGTQSITTIQCTGGGGGTGGASAPVVGANGTTTGTTNNTSGVAGWSRLGLGNSLFGGGIAGAAGTTGAGSAGTAGMVLIEY